MTFARIRIPNEEEAGKAFAFLVRRVPVDTYRDNVFVIPAPALDDLSGMGIVFEELGRGGLDFALLEMRNATMRQ